MKGLFVGGLLMVLALPAFAESDPYVEDLNTKATGHLLDVVSATDVTGTPIARYLQDMGQLGDKWNIDHSFDNTDRSDGVIKEAWTIINDGCRVQGASADCQSAMLTIKVEGKIGTWPWRYTTEYSKS